LRGPAKPGNQLGRIHLSFARPTRGQAAVADRTRNTAALVHTALKH
jgi:hypothetical protein